MGNLTDKQKAYRDSIVPRKKRKQHNTEHPTIKQKPKDIFMEEKIKYLKNCLYWLSEYNEGRGNKEKLSYTITAIEKHCAEIRNKILNN